MNEQPCDHEENGARRVENRLELRCSESPELFRIVRSIVESGQRQLKLRGPLSSVPGGNGVRYAGVCR